MIPPAFNAFVTNSNAPLNRFDILICVASFSLSNVDDCRNIISLTDKEFGTVNSLINVAGYTERGTILSTTIDNYDKNFNINTRAPFLLMQESIKIMIRDKNKGTIANVLSVAKYSGMPFLMAYSSSKAALGIMTKNIANAVSGHQIRVNGLNIGCITKAR